MDEVSRLNRACRRFKKGQDCRERYGQGFLSLYKDVLLMEFLIDQRTIDAAYYWKLLKD